MVGPFWLSCRCDIAARRATKSNSDSTDRRLRCSRAVGRIAAARRALQLIAAAATLAAFTGASHAWLGGFEAVDGYQSAINPVQNYNAGQYGANSGYFANAPAPITPNTGLWQVISGASGFGAYASGHAGYDRTWVNTNGGSGSVWDQGMVLTTSNQGWNGPALKYRYLLDQYDLGGVQPINTGGAVIDISFWWCAQLAGPEVGGQLPDGYFGDEIAFLDSNGNIGFVLGLTQRASGDKVTYWDGTQMLETNIVAASSKYDRWDIQLDLTNQTFTADYFHFNTNTLINLATNAPMMQPMIDFTEMTFRTSPGVNNAKLMSVDDFKIHVEEAPSCEVEIEKIDCKTGDPSTVSLTLTIHNNSGQLAKHIVFTPIPSPGPVQIIPNTLPNVNLPSGGSITVPVTITGLTTGQKFCFLVTLINTAGQPCCTFEVCFTPECDCWQVHPGSDAIDCDPATGDYFYTFQFDNLTNEFIYHSFFFVTSPANVSVSPTYQAHVPPVPPFGTSAPIFLTFSGLGNQGGTVCFEMSIHGENMHECCLREICIDFPPCGEQPVTGACCTPVGCLQVTAQECAAIGGIYQGDNTIGCPQPCFEPVGACCRADGSCLPLSALECEIIGGQYLGDNTSCNPNPCSSDGHGACCYCTPGGCGECAQLSVLECESIGGQYLGDNTSCNPNPCKTGACCLPDGTCAQTSSQNCAQSNGSYQGDGTVCGSDTCALGACCIPGAVCQFVSSAECAALGGSWVPNASCDRACRNGTPKTCLGDLNGDNSVGVADLLILLANWGSCPGQVPGCTGDLNLDGSVGVADLLILLSKWGDC